MPKSSAVVFEGGSEQSEAARFVRREKNDKSFHVRRQKASKELKDLATGSARVICEMQTVFPFNFFPDEVIVDETKVSVHTNYFIYTREVRSIEFRDVFNVVVQQGMFFSTLELIDRFFSQEKMIIKFLWNKDAHLLRRIIQGMIIARKEGIETHTLPVKELREKLERIGQSH